MSLLPTPHTHPFRLDAYLSDRRAQIEACLESTLQAREDYPSGLCEAMRYSLLAGGKRLRPGLVIAGAEAVGGMGDHVMPVAAAIEFIHTYSLVHDDLPAMDNDDLRRGKPTSHKVYGEAMAILVGDALLTQAFELLTASTLAERVGTGISNAVVRKVACAAGPRGMVGGQVIDLEATGQSIDLPRLLELHRLKTGALLEVSVVVGGMVGGGNEQAIAALSEYGKCLGLAFQIVDDILDVTSSTEALGKPQGSDARNRKSTFVDLLGLDASRERAEELIEKGKASIDHLGLHAQPLAALADFVIQRTS
jgi:geranylgeranyl diphosphate synthase type II